MPWPELSAGTFVGWLLSIMIYYELGKKAVEARRGYYWVIAYVRPEAMMVRVSQLLINPVRW